MKLKSYSNINVIRRYKNLGGVILGEGVWCPIGDIPDATVCRYLFTAKSLYMFQVSQHPSSGIIKTVTATSGTVTVTVTVFSIPDDGCCDTRNM